MREGAEGGERWAAVGATPAGVGSASAADTLSSGGRNTGERGCGRISESRGEVPGGGASCLGSVSEEKAEAILQPELHQGGGPRRDTAQGASARRL